MNSCSSIMYVIKNPNSNENMIIACPMSIIGLLPYRFIKHPLPSVMKTWNIPKISMLILASIELFYYIIIKSCLAYRRMALIPDSWLRIKMTTAIWKIFCGKPKIYTMGWVCGLSSSVWTISLVNFLSFTSCSISTLL